MEHALSWNTRAKAAEETYTASTQLVTSCTQKHKAANEKTSRCEDMLCLASSARHKESTRPQQLAQYHA